MKTWNRRPVEIRNLFNPAFCGLVVARAVTEFEKESPSGMPYSLSLLVLPLCLHKETRDILAHNKRSYFLKVVENNPQVLVGFGKRGSDLMPFTQEALGLLTNLGCLEISADAKLKIRHRSVRQATTGTEETKLCQDVARYIGRHFSRISDRATIYSSLGVRP